MNHNPLKMNEQKTNIVIIGASSEIGLAICCKFDKEENHLFVHCHGNKEKLINHTKDFKASVQIIPCDFSEIDQLNSFLPMLKDVSVLINAAAITKTNLLTSLSDTDIEKMLQVNVLATVKICKTVVPQMLIKRKGIILNITSVAASKGNKGQSVYGGTKGFIESFSRSLATELGVKGIRVNCIAPGVIEAGNMLDLLHNAPEEVKKSISLNKLGKPEDVANLVEFLCSEKAGFITGQTYHVDGGFQQGI